MPRRPSWRSSSSTSSSLRLARRLWAGSGSGRESAAEVATAGNLGRGAARRLCGPGLLLAAPGRRPVLDAELGRLRRRAAQPDPLARAAPLPPDDDEQPGARGGVGIASRLADRAPPGAGVP